MTIIQKFWVNVMVRKLLTSGTLTITPAHGMNGTDYEKILFKERVMSIISQHNSSSPLFLYYMPHFLSMLGLKCPKQIDNKGRQIYHAMVNYMDDITGNMISALKK